MPEHYRGFSSGAPGSDTVDLAERAAPVSAAYAADGDVGAVPANEQFARDIAEIERATAALRRAEPSLEMWSDAGSDARPDDTATTLAIHKTRPVWLLIGLLWLSTALVTVGAVAAIARLAG